MKYKISEIAELTSLTTYTLRYYEKEGLLWDVHRSENGQRYYTEKDVEMIQVIDCLKKTGMSIEDIKKYIDIFRHDITNASERVALFEKQKEIILRKMEELRNNLEMAEYKIWYYQNIGKLVDENDPLHCEKMRLLYNEQKNMVQSECLT